jgi:hypothetical protein
MAEVHKGCSHRISEKKSFNCGVKLHPKPLPQYFHFTNTATAYRYLTKAHTKYSIRSAAGHISYSCTAIRLQTTPKLTFYAQ